MSDKLSRPEFYARSKEIGLGAAYGEAIGREDWGDGLSKLVPEHLQMGIAFWLLFGEVPGHFLSAVLKGNLFEAIGRADDHSLAALPSICRFFYNYAPAGSYGSESKFKNWREMFDEAS